MFLICKRKIASDGVTVERQCANMRFYGLTYRQDCFLVAISLAISESLFRSILVFLPDIVTVATPPIMAMIPMAPNMRWVQGDMARLAGAWFSAAAAMSMKLSATAAKPAIFTRLAFKCIFLSSFRMSLSSCNLMLWYVFI